MHVSIDFNASYTMTIDGKPVSSPETIAVVNPATEEVVFQWHRLNRHIW